MPFPAEFERFSLLLAVADGIRRPRPSPATIGYWPIEIRHMPAIVAPASNMSYRITIISPDVLQTTTLHSSRAEPQERAISPQAFDMIGRSAGVSLMPSYILKCFRRQRRRHRPRMHSRSPAIIMTALYLSTAQVLSSGRRLFNTACRRMPTRRSAPPARPGLDAGLNCAGDYRRGAGDGEAFRRHGRLTLLLISAIAMAAMLDASHCH